MMVSCGNMVKILTSKDGIVTCELADGKIVVLNDLELAIYFRGTKLCKAGFDDIHLMSQTLRTIFGPEMAELAKLREQVKPTVKKIGNDTVLNGVCKITLTPSNP